MALDVTLAFFLAVSCAWHHRLMMLTYSARQTICCTMQWGDNKEMERKSSNATQPPFL